MDAVEFYKQFARYCSNGYCGTCPIVDECLTKSKKESDAEKVVRTIEQWAKEHPRKTRQGELLKMYPNAKLDSEGVLIIAPCTVDPEYCTNSIYEKGCWLCKKDYWFAEVE